jgi:hypothetical protein
VVAQQHQDPIGYFIRKNKYGVLDSYVEEVNAVSLREYSQTTSRNAQGASWHSDPLKPARTVVPAWRCRSHSSDVLATRSVLLRNEYIERTMKSHTAAKEQELERKPIAAHCRSSSFDRKDRRLQGAPRSGPPNGRSASESGLLTDHPTGPRELPRHVLSGIDRSAQHEAEESFDGNAAPSKARADLSVVDRVATLRNDGSGVTPRHSTVEDVSKELEVSPPTPFAQNAAHSRRDRESEGWQRREEPTNAAHETIPLAKDLLKQLTLPSTRTQRADLFQGHSPKMDLSRRGQLSTSPLHNRLEHELHLRHESPVTRSRESPTDVVGQSKALLVQLQRGRAGASSC